MKSILLITFLLLSVSLLALNPSRAYKQLPEKYNMKYEAVKIKVTDGHLVAWHIPANKKTSKLILIAHNGEGNMADYLRRSQFFHNLGYNVVTFDYRGYGESSDFEIDNNAYIYPHFQDDFQAMLNYCNELTSEKITLYGWGMGAGLVLGMGYNNADIDKIIADTPFLSMEDLESRFSKKGIKMKAPIKAYKRENEPIAHVGEKPKNPNLKAFLIVGSSDMLFNLKDMNQLTNATVSKEIYVVEHPDRKADITAKAPHADNFKINEAAYGLKVKQFLGSQR